MSAHVMHRYLLLLTLCSLVAGMCGCERKQEAAPAKDDVPVVKSQRVHEHKAPHGGTLVELGKEFAHLELMLDEKTGKLTLYVLDGEAERPMRLMQSQLVLKIKDQVVTLKAVANDLTGERVGDTSEFAGKSDLLKGVKSFDAVLIAIALRGGEFNNVAIKFPQGNDEHMEAAQHAPEAK